MKESADNGSVSLTYILLVAVVGTYVLAAALFVAASMVRGLL